MKPKNKIIILTVLVFISLGLLLYTEKQPRVKSENVATNKSGAGGDYNPEINPADFSTKITNKYFTLPVGRKLTYEGKVGNNVETNHIEIETGTKTIMGVDTIIYRDKVYVAGELTEDTKDYLAQDRKGNVWYFGEDVNNYDKGILKNHTGSWIAGLDGAKPGIWIKANPISGDSYRQEYYKGKAEDATDVLNVSQTVPTKLATYSGCVKMKDWSFLEANAQEYKYYCPEVGALVLTEDVETGERTELTKIVTP